MQVGKQNGFSKNGGLMGYQKKRNVYINKSRGKKFLMLLLERVSGQQMAGTFKDVFGF